MVSLEEIYKKCPSETKIPLQEALKKFSFKELDNALSGSFDTAITTLTSEERVDVKSDAIIFGNKLITGLATATDAVNKDYLLKRTAQEKVKDDAILQLRSLKSENNKMLSELEKKISSWVKYINGVVKQNKSTGKSGGALNYVLIHSNLLTYVVEAQHALSRNIKSSIRDSMKKLVDPKFLLGILPSSPNRNDLYNFVQSLPEVQSAKKRLHGSQLNDHIDNLVNDIISIWRNKLPQILTSAVSLNPLFTKELDRSHVDVYPGYSPDHLLNVFASVEGFGDDPFSELRMDNDGTKYKPSEKSSGDVDVNAEYISNLQMPEKSANFTGETFNPESVPNATMFLVLSVPSGAGSLIYFDENKVGKQNPTEKKLVSYLQKYITQTKSMVPSKSFGAVNVIAKIEMSMNKVGTTQSEATVTQTRYISDFDQWNLNLPSGFDDGADLDFTSEGIGVTVLKGSRKTIVTGKKPTVNFPLKESVDKNLVNEAYAACRSYYMWEGVGGTSAERFLAEGTVGRLWRSARKKMSKFWNNSVSIPFWTQILKKYVPEASKERYLASLGTGKRKKGSFLAARSIEVKVYSYSLRGEDPIKKRQLTDTQENYRVAVGDKLFIIFWDSVNDSVGLKRFYIDYSSEETEEKVQYYYIGFDELLEVMGVTPNEEFEALRRGLMMAINESNKEPSLISLLTENEEGQEKKNIPTEHVPPTNKIETKESGGAGVTTLPDGSELPPDQVASIMATGLRKMADQIDQKVGDISNAAKGGSSEQENPQEENEIESGAGNNENPQPKGEEQTQTTGDAEDPLPEETGGDQVAVETNSSESEKEAGADPQEETNSVPSLENPQSDVSKENSNSEEDENSNDDDDEDDDEDDEDDKESQDEKKNESYFSFQSLVESNIKRIFGLRSEILKENKPYTLNHSHIRQLSSGNLKEKASSLISALRETGPHPLCRALLEDSDIVAYIAQGKTRLALYESLDTPASYMYPPTEVALALAQIRNTPSMGFLSLHENEELEVAETVTKAVDGSVENAENFKNTPSEYPDSAAENSKIPSAGSSSYSKTTDPNEIPSTFPGDPTHYPNAAAENSRITEMEYEIQEEAEAVLSNANTLMAADKEVSSLKSEPNVLKTEILADAEIVYLLRNGNYKDALELSLLNFSEYSAEEISSVLAEINNDYPTEVGTPGEVESRAYKNPEIVPEVEPAVAVTENPLIPVVSEVEDSMEETSRGDLTDGQMVEINLNVREDRQSDICEGVLVSIGQRKSTVLLESGNTRNLENHRIRLLTRGGGLNESINSIHAGNSLQEVAKRRLFSRVSGTPLSNIPSRKYDKRYLAVYLKEDRRELQKVLVESDTYTINGVAIVDTHTLEKSRRGNLLRECEKVGYVVPSNIPPRTTPLMGLTEQLEIPQGQEGNTAAASFEDGVNLLTATANSLLDFQGTLGKIISLVSLGDGKKTASGTEKIIEKAKEVVKQINDLGIAFSDVHSTFEKEFPDAKVEKPSRETTSNESPPEEIPQEKEESPKEDNPPKTPDKNPEEENPKTVESIVANAKERFPLKEMFNRGEFQKVGKLIERTYKIKGEDSLSVLRELQRIC